MRAVLSACVAICAWVPAAASETTPALDAQSAAVAIAGDLEMGVPQYPGAMFLGVDHDEGASRFVFSTRDPKERVTAFYVQKVGALLQTGLSGPWQDFLSDPLKKFSKERWALLVQPRKGTTYIYVDRYKP